MNSNISLAKLQEHNPWWRRPEFILEDNFIVEFKVQKYPYYHPLYFSFPLNKDSVLTLRGPRRIGKTTLIKLLIQKLLLAEKIPGERVFFYPCDTLKDFRELEELLLLYLEETLPKTKDRLFIFLDEISFVKEWQRAIKVLVDSGRLKKTTCLITGSNILDLKFSSERLPGRRGEIFPWDIEFLPLTFSEFVKLLEPKLLEDPLTRSLDLLPKFKKLFSDYLLTGGFPVTINEYFSKGYIATETYEIFLAWIEGDLHKVGKSEESAYRILERLFTHLTTPVSLYRLSRESGLASHSTVEEYLEILEKMFLLFKTPFFSLGEKQVCFRKNRKIYFSDPFIFNCLRAKAEGFSQNAFSYSKEFNTNLKNRPLLVENSVAAFLKRKFERLYFGRFKDRELDFVGFDKGQLFYFEVKYQENISLQDFTWAKDVLKKNKLTVFSKNNYFEKEGIKAFPAELFLGFN